MRSKIHLHGINTGIGAYMEAMAAAGVQAGTMSLGNAGWTAQVARLSLDRGIRHHNIIRWTRPAGRRDDHPDEGLLDSDPKAAAEELGGYVLQALAQSPELNDLKELFRVQPTNEVSTNDHDPSNVGHFLTELAILLNAKGYAAALGGFNAGQPEPDHWHAEGMRRLLAYLADNPQNTIALHEGKPGDPSQRLAERVSSFVPHAVGRFRYLLQAADDQGVARPRIDITEWAWGYDNMPSHDIAMRDVKDLAALYNQAPEVNTVLLWNINPGSQWGDLPGKLLGLMPTLQAYNKQAQFPDPEPEDPPPDEEEETLAQRAWRISLDQQKIQLNPDAALQKVILGDGFVPTEPEWRMSWSGAHFAGQGAENLATGERRVYMAEVGQWHDVFHVAGPDQGAVYIPYLGLSSPLSGSWIIGSLGHFNARRDYANGLHEGLDGIPTEPGSLALASRAGRVVRTGYNPDGYGHFVKLEHLEPLLFYTWYGHLADVRVSVGQHVARAGVLGRVGSTGNSTGVHIHLTVEVPGLGLDGYAVPDVIDPLPHMDRTPIALPPPGTGSAQLGLHATADPRLAAGEVQLFQAGKIDLIKVLSNIDPTDVQRLKAARPNANWIIRAFLAMYDGQPRRLTPEQFYNDTISDVRRTITALGLDPSRIKVELHNEPNLTLEGLGGSWANGQDFAGWWLQLLAMYRQGLPGIQLGFPGLSPGPGMEIRQEKYGFLNQAIEAVRAADWIGDHTYWGVGETVQAGVAKAAAFSGWLQERGISRPIYETEASDKSTDSGSAKGQRYIQFWQGIRGIPQIQGVTYFVASATHPDFQKEVWVRNGSSLGIAETVGQR